MKNVKPVKGDAISIAFDDGRESNGHAETTKRTPDGRFAMKELCRYCRLLFVAGF
jgi:hypothetical protein